jgi:hypothetical protein
MRTIVFIVGLIALAMGLLWIGQGEGWILWPRESFMLGRPQWVWYGTGLAVTGALVMIFARRR